ncbi:MAG: hypothetical protein WD491_14335 [Balneolales bacterium]
MTHQLAGAMIYLGKKADSIEDGVAMSRQAIDDGSAFLKFVDITAEQGGEVDFLYHPEKYPEAQSSFNITADADGYISRMNAYDFGMAAVELGAGRAVKEDIVDPVSGISLSKKVGDLVKKGETIAVCFTNKTGIKNAVRQRLVNSLDISGEESVARPMIASMLTGSNVES